MQSNPSIQEQRKSYDTKIKQFLTANPRGVATGKKNLGAMLPDFSSIAGRTDGLWLPIQDDTTFGQQGLDAKALTSIALQLAPSVKKKKIGARILTDGQARILAGYIRNALDLAEQTTDVPDDLFDKMAEARKKLPGKARPDDFLGTFTPEVYSKLATLQMQGNYAKPRFSKYEQMPIITQRGGTLADQYAGIYNTTQPILNLRTGYQWKRNKKAQNIAAEEALRGRIITDALGQQTAALDALSNKAFPLYAPRYAQALQDRVKQLANPYMHDLKMSNQDRANKNFVANYPDKLIRWNQTTKRWQNLVDSSAIPGSRGGTQNARQNADALIKTQLNQAQVEKFIPPIVKNLLAANQQLGFSGVGPVGKNSFPLYVGRYLDPLTGEVRTVPKPSAKYVNPRNLGDVIKYNEARVLSAWNSFVRTQQQLYNLYMKMADGNYIRNLARKQRLNANKDFAIARNQAQAYKNLVRSILKGKLPYGMTVAQGQEILTLYQLGKFSQIDVRISRQNQAIGAELSYPQPKTVLKEAIWWKYSDTFNQRGQMSYERYMAKNKLPVMSKDKQLLSFYPNEIKNSFRDAMNKGAIRAASGPAQKMQIQSNPRVVYFQGSPVVSSFKQVPSKPPLAPAVMEATAIQATELIIAYLNNQTKQTTEGLGRAAQLMNRLPNQYFAKVTDLLNSSKRSEQGTTQVSGGS